MTTHNNLDDKARKIQDIANGLGWDSDLPTLIERVRQMDNGLVQEDEFIYLLNWSNRCSLIHKTDQFIIPPDAKNTYSIPDLFVVVNDNGKEKSYFIEIKTSEDNKLSWTDKYYTGLINYSKATNIPILVAWKWRSFDIWTLFELSHFTKAVSNYKIGFEKAHEENLMSQLVGDFVIIPYDEFALRFKFKKNSVINKTGEETLWQTVCESISIIGEGGKEISEIEPNILSFLFSIPLEESDEESETHITKTFIPYNKTIFAQSVPIQLAKAFSDTDVNWLIKIKNQEFHNDRNGLYESLTKGIEKGFIRNILNLNPKSDKKTTGNSVL